MFPTLILKETHKKTYHLIRKTSEISRSGEKFQKPTILVGTIHHSVAQNDTQFKWSKISVKLDTPMWLFSAYKHTHGEPTRNENNYSHFPFWCWYWYFLRTDLLLGMLPQCLRNLSSSISRIEVKYPEDECEDNNNYYYPGKREYPSYEVCITHGSPQLL